MILADLTQDSLSAFHTAGVERRKQGLQDIIDNRHSPNTGMVIAGNIKRDAIYRPLKYYVKSISTSIIDDNIRGDDFWYDIGREMGILPQKGDGSSNVIVRFYLDYGKLLEDDRTLEYIVKKVFDQHPFVYRSPDFMGIIDVHIANMIELSGVVKTVDTVMGIPGIQSYDTNTTTSGSNLHEVCIHKNVDPSETTSSDVYDVERTFGLEAARKVIYDEVIACGCDKDAAAFVADFMTCKGYVSPFQKDNPMLADKGFLPSIAFERPKKDLKQALEQRRVDIDSSVYSQFILGRLPDVGTGSKLFNLGP